MCTQRQVNTATVGGSPHATQVAAIPTPALFPTWTTSEMLSSSERTKHNVGAMSSPTAGLFLTDTHAHSVDGGPEFTHRKYIMLPLTMYMMPPWQLCSPIYHRLLSEVSDWLMVEALSEWKKGRDEIKRGAGREVMEGHN